MCAFLIGLGILIFMDAQTLIRLRLKLSLTQAPRKSPIGLRLLLQLEDIQSKLIELQIRFEFLSF